MKLLIFTTLDIVTTRDRCSDACINSNSVLYKMNILAARGKPVAFHDVKQGKIMLHSSALLARTA